MRPFPRFSCTLLLLSTSVTPTESFAPPRRLLACRHRRSGGARATTAQLNAIADAQPRGGARGQGSVRSKRQERVGHLVRTELASILHSGVIKGRDVEYLDDELRRRISVVSADVSPDMRQARVSVSIRKGAAAAEGGGGADGSGTSHVIDQRRAYSWLVGSTKAIRHTLAQRMSHMKTCPTLTFVQVNVGAAVDVMYLIDKISKGYKRESVDEEDLMALDDDEEGDDWMSAIG